MFALSKECFGMFSSISELNVEVTCQHSFAQAPQPTCPMGHHKTRASLTLLNSLYKKTNFYIENYKLDL